MRLTPFAILLAGCLCGAIAAPAMAEHPSAVAVRDALRRAAAGPGDLASSQGCGPQRWPGSIHFAVIDGRLGPRRLDCRGPARTRRIDAYLDDDAYVRDFWNKTMGLAPIELRAKVAEFIVSGAHSSQGGGAAAYVSLADRGATRFNFGVSIHGFQNPKTWTETEIRWNVMHEYGHIVSLDASELSKRDGDCQTHQPWPDFCARPESIIERYRLRFWPGDRANGQRRGGLVSQYAGTNEEEDFAETFAVWIMAPERLRLSPTLRAKAAFLEGEPKLRAVRDAVRARLNDERTGAAGKSQQ